MKALKVSKLIGPINYLIQFLFIRIYARIPKHIDPEENSSIEGFGILYFVWPLTGWGNSKFKTIGKLKISKLLWKKN